MHITALHNRQHGHVILAPKICILKKKSRAFWHTDEAVKCHQKKSILAHRQGGKMPSEKAYFGTQTIW